MTIDVSKELEDANARLPMIIDSTSLPLDVQVRSIALTIAQRHVGDTCIKEGGLYQQLKMDNKLGHSISIDDVMKAALIMERYLWGEWSKGIAENALAATETNLADAIEKEFERKMKGLEDEPPTRGSAGEAK